MALNISDISTYHIQSFETIVEDLMNDANYQYQNGHDIFQVVPNTIYTGYVEKTTGVVLYCSNITHPKLHTKLEYKLEYSQFGSIDDFYTHVETVLNELTESRHRIHCISVDSFANYQGLFFSEITYCLIVYSYEPNIRYSTRLQTLKANKHELFSSFVGRLSEMASNLSQKFTIMHIGMDSFQEGIFINRQESTMGFIVYNINNRERALFATMHVEPGPKTLHIKSFDILFESENSYKQLLDQIQTYVRQRELSCSGSLISVNIDAFITPGRTYLRQKHKFNALKYIRDLTVPVTLVALVSYYT
jgi:hypothetical protein